MRAIENRIDGGVVKKLHKKRERIKARIDREQEQRVTQKQEKGERTMHIYRTRSPPYYKPLSMSHPNKMTSTAIDWCGGTHHTWPMQF